MENEIWKPVLGYEGLYEVSSLGRLKFLERTVIRKNGTSNFLAEEINLGTFCKSGYFQVALTKDGIHKTFRRSRIVAIAFLPNPENKKCVNHIDRNRQNDSVDNLEWTTHMENTHHFMKQKKNGDVVGVSYRKATDRWLVGVMLNGKRFFDAKSRTKEEAIQLLKAVQEKNNISNKYA